MASIVMCSIQNPILVNDKVECGNPIEYKNVIKIEQVGETGLCVCVSLNIWNFR